MGWVWGLALAALVLAAASWVAARRAARQAAQLTDMYWQLRYDHGELKARLDAVAPAPGAAPPTPPGTHFVALTDVKR
ncbi:MAG: hypothetical protein AB7U83_03085 [Vicinamibacterales bacterium]